MADKTHDFYLSSTLSDLGPERKAIAQAIGSARKTVLQSYNTDNRPPVQKCLADVRACQVYVGIIGWCYGGEVAHPTTHLSKSFTEHEFDEAGRADIHRHVFMHANRDKIAVGNADSNPKKINAFRKRIGKAVTPVEYEDLDDLLRKLPNVFQRDMPKLAESAGQGDFLDRLPKLPAPWEERHLAVDAAVETRLCRLTEALPTAGAALQSLLRPAAHADNTASVTARLSINNLTGAFENAQMRKAFDALREDDRGHFLGAARLLIRLAICRGFSTDGWHQMGQLTGADRLDAADIHLLHMGTQAARGLDFDLPQYSAVTYSPYLHLLDPDLNAGVGRNKQRQITDEAAQRFGFDRPRPSDDAGQALDGWHSKLDAHVFNKCEQRKRRYAVAEAVADADAAAALVVAAKLIHALALPFAVKDEDAFMAEPTRYLVDAIEQCIKAMHRLSQPATPTP